VSVELAPCIYAFLSCCNVSSLCPTVPLYLCAPALFSGSFLRRLCVQRLFGHSLSYQEVNLRLALQFAQPLKLRQRLLLLRRISGRPLRLGELKPRHFIHRVERNRFTQRRERLFGLAQTHQRASERDQRLHKVRIIFDSLRKQLSRAIEPR